MAWKFSQAFIAKNLLAEFRQKKHRNPKSVEELLKVLRIPSIYHASIKKSFKALEKKKNKEHLIREDIKGL